MSRFIASLPASIATLIAVLTLTACGGGASNGSISTTPPVGENTIPGGQHNLFMFSLVNDHNAIMDALAR